MCIVGILVDFGANPCRYSGETETVLAKISTGDSAPYLGKDEFSPTERRSLELMIIDCESHYMTENQSRNYINKRLGRINSRRTYYNHKTKAH